MFRSFKGDHKNRNPVFNFQRIRRNFKKKKAPSIQHKPGGRMEGREEGKTEQRRGTVYKRHGK